MSGLVSKIQGRWRAEAEYVSATATDSSSPVLKGPVEPVRQHVCAMAADVCLVAVWSVGNGAWSLETLVNSYTWSHGRTPGRAVTFQRRGCGGSKGQDP